MTAPTQASRLLRRQEAAQYLGIGVVKLYELTNEGQIASVEIWSRGGKRPSRRWELDELNRFITERRTGGAP
ncbi:MAG TPA: helix-turn-helix domain-containing protein [Streptosporangiaceae bacterium]